MEEAEVGECRVEVVWLWRRCRRRRKRLGVRLGLQAGRRHSRSHRRRPRPVPRILQRRRRRLHLHGRVRDVCRLLLNPPDHGVCALAADARAFDVRAAVPDAQLKDNLRCRGQIRAVELLHCPVRSPLCEKIHKGVVAAPAFLGDDADAVHRSDL
jgi:xanthine/CO dehydrogenase XdhC/CoxF family maturation factor